MKGKIGFYYVTVPPEDAIKYVWKTKVPLLSFVRHEVDHIFYHKDSKNFSIVCKPLKEGRKGIRVICEWNNEQYIVKRNIQFSERDACKRLANHISEIITGKIEIKNTDIDIVNKNMEFLKNNYPEFVV